MAAPSDRAAPVIREERAGDEPAIAEVITAAFRGHPFSQGREAAIVAELRRRHALVVGLVAEEAGAIVGHVAFSAARIEGSGRGWFALGPLAVRPDRQRLGIGTALAKAGLAALRPLGAKGCVLLGDPAYYGRLGFRAQAGLRYEAVPAENVLGLAFGAEDPAGEIVFHSAFYA